MAMVLADQIEEEMNRWLGQWVPNAMRENAPVLECLKRYWRSVDKEYPLEEDRRENCFRALWILGYELSRDGLLDPKLPELPATKRAQRIIEDEGPLLFAFYSRSDEERFGVACRDIELALRRRGEWDRPGTSPT
jgi:hypothetical protein